MFPRPTSFEEACAMRGYDPATVLPDVSNMPEHLRQYTIDQTKRVIIAEAIKEGIHPKPGEWRYAPYFWSPSASAFVFYFTDYTITDTYLGARLEFTEEHEDRAEYFGRNFTDLHKSCLLVE